MKFSATIFAAAFGFASISSAITVSYDPGFDIGTNSLNDVACSNGENGLVTKGYTTYNSLPSFPYIGGYEGVAGWNSPQCGTCYGLTYNGKTIYVLAVDHAVSGFNIAQQALDDLTNGHAVEFGRIDAVYSQVDKSNCKLPA